MGGKLANIEGKKFHSFRYGTRAEMLRRRRAYHYANSLDERIGYFRVYYWKQEFAQLSKLFFEKTIDFKTLVGGQSFLLNSRSIHMPSFIKKLAAHTLYSPCKIYYYLWKIAKHITAESINSIIYFMLSLR